MMPVSLSLCVRVRVWCRDIRRQIRQRTSDCSQDVYWDFLFFSVTLAKELDFAVEGTKTDYVVLMFWETNNEEDHVLYENHKFANDTYEVAPSVVGNP